MACAEGRGLASRRALRFCRAARRDGRAHETLALDHRRQSRSERRLALSRSGDDRIMPDYDLRRRAALSGGRGARRGGDRRAAATILRSLSCGAQRRDRAIAPVVHGASRCSTPIRFVRASRVCSTANCRCSIWGPTRARAARASAREGRSCSFCRGFEFRRPTAASRAAGSRAPLASRRRASRPCKWSSPAAPICRSRSARRRQLAVADRPRARGADARDAQEHSGDNAGLDRRRRTNR